MKLTNYHTRGRLTLDRANSGPKLLCKNYECGILIPVEDAAETKAKATTSSSHDDDSIDEKFHGVVPVPMKLPATPFEGSPETPWFYLG